MKCLAQVALFISVIALSGCGSTEGDDTGAREYLTAEFNSYESGAESQAKAFLRDLFSGSNNLWRPFARLQDRLDKRRSHHA
jgi:hypothetical protein